MATSLPSSIFPHAGRAVRPFIKVDGVLSYKVNKLQLATTRKLAHFHLLFLLVIFFPLPIPFPIIFII